METAFLVRIFTTAIPLLAAFLGASEAVRLVVFSRDGIIRFVNPAMAADLKADIADMAGRSFHVFLTQPDSDMLSGWLSGSLVIPETPLLLNVVGSDQIPRSLYCRIAVFDDGFLMIAEPPRGDDQALQEALLQLNNQLTVLSRENVRKGRELARALADLKKTQAMLVHQEKMASLGQMTAGIAHEINNPVAYVLSNEQTLQRDFEAVMAFINILGDALPEIAVPCPRIHADIINNAREIGLQYLAEAIPRKISANIEGLDRIRKIVLDLRNFSRLDEAERKYCHLAEGIESTLRFLGPLMQEHGVSVRTELVTLPQVLCSPGPLNQAIQNILANAIQASPPDQWVRVATRMDENWYCIEVTDQGAGIPAENLSRVFDPFFTTKPVGSGTGLGLSIAHQVVDAHGGRIEIDSRPNMGTTVRILLPRERQATV